MKKHLATVICAAVLLLIPLSAKAADLPPEQTDTGSVSENAPQGVSENAIDIPGWGSLSQEDIDELAGMARQATGEYLDQNNERPLIIEREPDLELLYLPEYNHYRYVFPDGQWIEYNVPQGAYCRGRVEFFTSQGITGVTYYKDGVTQAGKGPFLEDGSYVMVFWDLNVFGDVNRAYRLDYCFTIYNDYRMNLTHMQAPAGMHVEQVLYEGEEQEVSRTDYVQAYRDGNYHIVFTGAGGVFETDFIRDTTPPVIRFEPEYRIGQKYEQELTYQINETDASLQIFRNYVSVELPDGVIGVNGDYRLEVKDPVGNVRNYVFNVRAPVQVFSAKMLLIPLVLLLAAIGAAAYWRRNMRVL